MQIQDHVQKHATGVAESGNMDNSPKYLFKIGQLEASLQDLAYDDIFLKERDPKKREQYIKNIIDTSTKAAEDYARRINLKENTMKKSELKQLLKVITEEVIAAKKSKLDETKGLSGFKKAKESTEHTENVADSKSLTPTSEPKEKEENKKLPVVKKPANPQKVGSIKENNNNAALNENWAMDVIMSAMGTGLNLYIQGAIVALLVHKLYTKTGRLPWPFNKFVRGRDGKGLIDRAISKIFGMIKSIVSKEAEKDKRDDVKEFNVDVKLRQLQSYCDNKADQLAGDSRIAAAIEKKDFKSLVALVHEEMVKSGGSKEDQDWVRTMATMQDAIKDVPSSTIYSLVLFYIVGKKPGGGNPEPRTPLKLKPKEPATTPKEETGLKEEIIQMIREEIDEMARVKGAVGNKFKVEDPNSPTGWVVKGHKTIPDGTPTEAPKGPYQKTGTNPNMGRPKTTPVVSTGTGTQAEIARTEEAVEEFMKYNPNATEQEVVDAIAEKSTEETPLSLDAKVIQNAMEKAKADAGTETDSSEPDIANLAASEKAAKQAKMNRLRQYLLKKKGLK